VGRKETFSRRKGGGKNGLSTRKRILFPSQGGKDQNAGKRGVGGGGVGLIREWKELSYLSKGGSLSVKPKGWSGFGQFNHVAVSRIECACDQIKKRKVTFWLHENSH